MLPVEWENANIPALLRPLILEAQVGFCYTLLFEPLAYCSHFHHRVTTESFTIDSPVDIPVSASEDLETSVKVQQLGMHLSLSVVVSILIDGVDDTREDLLVAFLLPRDLFVDMYELEILHDFNWRKVNIHSKWKYMDTESMSEYVQNNVLVLEFVGLLSVLQKKKHSSFHQSRCRNEDLSQCPSSFTFTLPVHIRYHAMSNCNRSGEPFSQIFIPPPRLLVGRVPRGHETSQGGDDRRQVDHYYDLNRHRYSTDGVYHLVSIGEGMPVAAAVPVGDVADIYFVSTISTMAVISSSVILLVLLWIRRLSGSGGGRGRKAHLP